MSTFSFSAQAPEPAGVRVRVRDAAVGLFVALPTVLRVWLYEHLLRPILWIFFHLEKRPIVAVRAGPSGNRFKMRLCWQSHIVYALGIYEPQLIQLLRECVKAGDFCIDAGAHLGYLTLFLSQLVGESGSVASFEPVPENFRVLQENVGMNHAENVELRNVALLDSRGPVKMVRVTQQTLSWSPSAVNESADPQLSSVPSEATTLDDFIADRKKNPKFIKIDVEGAELHVLRGAINTLRMAAPMLFLEIHNWGKPASAEVLDFLRQHGYNPQILGTRGDEAFCFAVPSAQNK